MTKLFLAFASFAVSAFAVLFISATAYAQTTDPAITQGLCSGADLSLSSNCSQLQASQSTEQLNRIILTIINTLSVIVGLVAVVMIIVGGFRYVTSGSSDTGITSAKNTILYAIIGLVIVAVAQLLVRFVLNKLTTPY